MLSLVELSRVASTRYSEDFRTGQLVFSRGGLLAAALDDHITAWTRGAKSLRSTSSRGCSKATGRRGGVLPSTSLPRSSGQPRGSTSQRSSAPR